MVRANANDPWVDTVDFGPEPWAQEVAGDIRARTWIKNFDLFWFVLDDTDELIGAAQFSIRKRPDPDDEHKSLFLLVLEAGVVVTHQGEKDPSSVPVRSYATVIMEELERKARASPLSPVGMTLLVQTGNVNAQEFYAKRCGFALYRGPFQLEENGPEYVEMRKYF